MRSFTKKIHPWLTTTLSYFASIILCLALTTSLAAAQSQDTGDGDVSNDVPTIGTDDSEEFGEPEYSEPANYGGDDGGDFSGRRMNDSQTIFVARELEAASGFCSGVDEAYGVDCLSDQYEQVASSLPNHGDYAPVKKALISAAQELAALAQANRDPALPVVRPEPKAKAKAAAPRGKATRALVPVRKRAMPKVKKAALKIVEETQTILLRSAENSRRRKISYARISKAIDSNKILLRSI